MKTRGKKITSLFQLCTVVAMLAAGGLAAQDAAEAPKDPPRTLRYLLDLIEVHFKYRQLNAAKPLLEEAEQIAKNDAEKRRVYQELANFHRRQQNYAKEVEYREKELALTTDDYQQQSTRVQMVSAYAALEEYDKAEQLAREVLASDNANFRNQGAYLVVMVHDKKGDLAEFRKAVEKRFETNPEDVQNVMLMARVAERHVPGDQEELPNPQKQIPLHKRLLELEPDNPTHLFRLVDLYRESEQPEKAIELLEKRVGKSEHEDLQVSRMIADLYLDMDNKEKAIEWIEKLPPAKGNPATLIQRARFMQRVDKLPEALALIDEAVEKETRPELAVQWELLGAEFLQKGKRYNDAVRVLQAIMRNENYSPQMRQLARQNLVEVLAESGKLEEIDLDKDKE